MSDCDSTQAFLCTGPHGYDLLMGATFNTFPDVPNIGVSCGIVFLPAHLLAPCDGHLLQLPVAELGVGADGQTCGDQRDYVRTKVL